MNLTEGVDVTQRLGMSHAAQQAQSIWGGSEIILDRLPATCEMGSRRKDLSKQEVPYQNLSSPNARQCFCVAIMIINSFHLKKF